MTKLLLLTLLLNPTPVMAENHYCEEIWAVLQENILDGLLTYREAASIMGRCKVAEFHEK